MDTPLSSSTTHTKRRRWRQVSMGLGAGAIATLLVGLTIPGCSVGYVIRSAWFQAELLSSREPIEKVKQTNELSAEQMAALDQIADIKAYGAEIGLSATKNYETLAIDWRRKIWNVSACPVLSFEPVSWWFPIVGRVPYLGYFREQDARAEEARLIDKGYETYVRTAGAYSTLGWFRDPILLPMLNWGPFSLADTVLHELAHATVWIPGSVKFNESFANFVGEEAAFRYLDEKYGPEHEVTLKANAWFQDSILWRNLLHQMYKDLDAIYNNDNLTELQKRDQRTQVFQGITETVEQTDFVDSEKWEGKAARGTWNNARLMQFRTYNDLRPTFATLLERNEGDLLTFMNQIQEITAGKDDPEQAVRDAIK